MNNLMTLLPSGVSQLIVALGLAVLGWAALESSWLLASVGFLILALMLAPHLSTLN